MSLAETSTKARTDCTKKKFVFLGCGSVAKCAIYYLQEFFEVDYNLVHIVDEIDMRNVPALQDVFKKGANFYKLRLEDDDYERLFKLFKLNPFDVVVDLTTNVNVFKIIEAVRKLSLHYLNTSMEINWHFNANSSIYDESLYKRHVMAEEVAKNVQDPNNASMVYEFGMNPGLISHFTFRAIVDVAKLVLKEKEDKELQEMLDKREYAKMCKYLGVELVHCSEIDTQIGKNVKDDSNVFVNTWSCIGLLEEGLEPVQLGWGTHEKTLPKNAEVMEKYLIGLKTPAYQKLHRSYVPDEEIVGTVIPHGEGVTLTQALSLPDYSPTVHYVYRLCPQTRALLAKVPFDELKRLKEWRVMDPLTDQLEGDDRIGCLLVLNKNPITGEKKNWSYWCGSILGQELSKFFGPTVIQVAAGVLTATKWMIENPAKGPVYSEALPTDWVLDVAKPYLGVLLSKPVAWSPPSTQFADLEVQP